MCIRDSMIGGQAGISGHLKIGNNVQIGGGSGVIKNIPDNSKVMGYPAKDLKNFTQILLQMILMIMFNKLKIYNLKIK